MRLVIWLGLVVVPLLAAPLLSGCAGLRAHEGPAGQPSPGSYNPITGQRGSSG